MIEYKKARSYVRRTASQVLPDLYLWLLRRKKAIARSGTVTSLRARSNDRRLEPSFFVCGTRKGGTTFLYRLLAGHPQVREPVLKEVNFLEVGEMNKTGLSDSQVYRSFFPFAPRGAAKRLITGESTPHYMFYPHSGAKLAREFPNAKLLLVLREPSSRAYSEYRMNVNRGTETLSFEEAIASEEERTGAEWQRWLEEPDYWSDAVAEFSYQRRGLYLDQIKRLEQSYPSDQIMVLRSNDVWKDSANTLKKVEEFLGIEEWLPETIVPENVGTTKTKPNPDTMGCLKEYFRPHNEELFNYLGWEDRW